ncbi:hypothetical protein CO110_00220, partial [Candidatus Desantisbacteria bacterium CG_4_9_14_3_um_filter_40_11]
MRKSGFLKYVPAIAVILIAFVLKFGGFDYNPFHALRSEQIDRTFLTIISSDKVISETEINLLKQAIVLSPNNCGAYVSLGIAYLDFAFPETDEGKSYNPDFNNEKRVYDEMLAAEILDKLDFALSNCNQYTILIRLMKGNLYYLMGEPQSALEELKSLDLNEMDTDNSIYAYEIMSASYEDLNDPLNAALSLIFSLSEGHKSNAEKDLIKIEEINRYLHNTEISIIPNRGAGFGRYSVASIYDNQMKIFGVIDGTPSILVYLNVGNEGSIISSKVLDAGESVWGSVALDNEGNTHVAYLLGERYIIYANSKDDFTSKVIIDSHNTMPSILEQPNRVRLTSIQIVFDYQNQPHLIWSYGLGKLGYTVIKNDKADVPTIIANDSIFPDIKVSANGVVSIVYNNYENFPNPTTQVWYLEQQDGTWKQTIQISEAGMWAGSASIISDDNGNLHVFYITGTSSEDLALMHAIRDLQGNWLSPEIIGSGNHRPFLPGSSDGSPISFSGRTAPSVALLSGNRVAVIWRGTL